MIVQEIEVDSHSDIQAERDAWKKLDLHDRYNVISLKVLEDKDGYGAMDRKQMYAWHFAKDNFESADIEHLEQ